MFRRSALLLTLCLATATAQATLVGRSAFTPGGTDYQAYYDDVLNITWVADANLAATETFGVSGIAPSGPMSWDKANEWIAAMNTAAYLGKSDWRLPAVDPLSGTFNYSDSYNGSTDRGYNVSEQGTAYAGSTASEMAHLYYHTLDNKAFCAPTSVYPICTLQVGWGLSNKGPFSNLKIFSYWSGTDYAPSTSAWVFNFDGGWQGHAPKSYDEFAWAVHDGDIGSAVVPTPPAVWLFGSALGLMGVMRRKVST